MSTLAKDSTVSLISRVVVLGAAMLTSAMISRTLGASLQGTYNVFVLIVNTSMTIFSFSASVGTIILGAQDPKRLPQLLGNALIMASALGGLALLSVFLLLQVPTSQEYLQENGIDDLMIAGILLMLPVTMYTVFLREIIRGAGWITQYNVVMVLPYLSNLVFLVAALILQPGMVAGAVAAWVTAQVITMLVIAYMAWRAAGFRIGVDLKLMRFSLGYGARSHLGLVSQLLNYRLYVFLIGVFLPTDYIGYYTISTLYAERIWEFPTAIRTALLYHASANSKDAPQITAQTTRVAMVFVTLTTAGLAVVAYPFIILVHGPAFQPAVLPLIILMPGVWMLSLGKLLGVYLASINRPEIGTYAGIISLVVTLFLDLWLIPQLGIPGAALASSVSYTVSTLVITGYFLRVTGLKWMDVSVIRRSDLYLLRRALNRMMRPGVRSSESKI